MKPLLRLQWLHIILTLVVLQPCVCFSQALNYTESNASIAYTYNPAPTILGALPPGIDDGLTPPVSIGFNFQFGCTGYSQFMASSNGWMTFNMGCISSDPNNQLAGNATQTINAERPIISALWDDLDVDATGNVNYQMFGATPNRTLVIEWKKMRWKVSATGPVITFQVRLMETSNNIEFWYKQESAAISSGASASFGLAGPLNGDYYSLTNSSAAPGVAHNAGEVTTIASKPATNQVYQWFPVCFVLPVELLSFSVEDEDPGTLLQWITATEENSDHFTVERSTDGIVFADVGTVKSAGFSTSEKRYTFTDSSARPSTLYYYRLKQTDHDQKFSFSEIITADPSVMKNKLRVFPNPASDRISVNEESGKEYLISSSSGEIVLRGWLLENEINVSGLAPGLYTLSVNGNFRKIAVCR